MAELPGAVAPAWREIGTLARLVGAYCWAEDRIFGLAGEWAGREELAAETRLWCAAASRRHGLLACAWAERLPVRAGVDRAGLVVAPGPGASEAFEALAAAPAASGVLGLLTVVLPCLQRLYRSHLCSASPVSEAPVAEVLVRAARELAGELKSADRLPSGGLDNWRSVVGAPLADALSAFVQAWGDPPVLPAERPS